MSNAPDPQRQYAPGRVFARPSGPNGQGPWQVYQTLVYEPSPYGGHWHSVKADWYFETCPTLAESQTAWENQDFSTLERLSAIREHQAYKEHVLLGDAPLCVDPAAFNLKFSGYGQLGCFAYQYQALSSDPAQRALQAKVPPLTRAPIIQIKDGVNPASVPDAATRTQLSLSGERIDCAWIVATCPKIDTLSIQSHPGPVCILDNFAALKQLRGMRHLHLQRCFGFGAVDIASPSVWLHWDSVILSSVPKDVHDHVKARMWDFAHVLVASPRNASWVAANVNNPLAIWDGRDNIPPKALKAATKAYQKLHMAMTKIGDAKRANPDKARDAVAAFIQTLNSLPGASLETVEREEIGDILIQFVSLCGGALDEDSIGDIYDQTRDF